MPSAKSCAITAIATTRPIPDEIWKARPMLTPSSVLWPINAVADSSPACGLRRCSVGAPSGSARAQEQLLAGAKHQKGCDQPAHRPGGVQAVAMRELEYLRQQVEGDDAEDDSSRKREDERQVRAKAYCENSSGQRRDDRACRERDGSANVGVDHVAALRWRRRLRARGGPRIKRAEFANTGQ